MTDRYAFHDLPEDSFPFTIECFADADTGGKVPLYRVEVSGPGALEIPPLRDKHGTPVWTRVTWADGNVTDSRNL